MISFARGFGLKIVSLVFLIAFTAIFNFTAYGAGEVDTSFSASVYNIQNSGATVAVAQADGKVLIGGSFSVVNGVARHGLTRLNADGTVDSSFNPPDFFDPTLFLNSLGATVNAIALQSNGKILVGGRFNIIGSTYKSLVRLNTDGSLDASFINLNLQLGNSLIINRIVIRPDDSIYYSFGGTVKKLDSNGVADPNFNFFPFGGSVRDFVVQTDGKIVFSDIHVTRYSATGGGDGTFQVAVTNGGVNRMMLQSDGKILIAGTFSTVNGFVQGGIARLNTDGTIDLTFNTNGVGANTGTNISDIVIASDGKIFIGGTFTQFNGVSKSKVAKLNADGTLDASFTYTPPNANTIIKDVEIQGNGKVVIVGDQTAMTTTTITDSVSQLNSNGSLDTGFLTKIGRSARVREIIQQTDDKVLITGDFPLVNGVARNSLARLNADGTLDTTFVPYFNGLTTNQSIQAVATQTDGKILVGAVQGIILRRLNTDGSQDTGFVTTLQSSAIIHDIFVMSDARILIAGNFRFAGDTANRYVARLNSNGSVDTSFTSTQPNAVAYRVQRQADGKVFICGEFTQIGGFVRGRIARFNDDGSLDTSFNPPGGANGAVYDFDLQSDGKVIIGGVFTQLNGSSNQQRIGRLNADGNLDTGFVQTANSTVNAIEVQPDGKILIGGIMTQVGGVARTSIARLNANGTLDSAFTAYSNLTVLDISLQTDNKILLGGEFTEVNNFSSVTAARLLNSLAPPKTLFDYDGDGRADVSVFRSSTNRWYEFLSSNSTVTEQTFGLSGDVVAPADYDGDGKTDIGIFRPSSGDWWYLSSINNAQVQTHWGASGDIPRPSDFDGDGKADFVVFRPSENNWYRFGSTGAVSIVNFGLAGDKPVVGDFDGDSKADVAIYRPSTGTWWYRSSINNAQIATQFGISSDIPTAADFDGDSKTDLAVYRASTGTWYILNSSNGQATIINFGLAEDKPVAADYDGDGKADIAVFRPSTGIWYLLRSTAGFTALQFGISTDTPTPNAFVP